MVNASDAGSELRDCRSLAGVRARQLLDLDKRLRVLYVHSGNLFGGVETLMLTIVQHQSLCGGMESHFALCFEGQFSERLSALGAPKSFLGTVRVSQPLTVRRARRNLRR